MMLTLLLLLSLLAASARHDWELPVYYARKESLPATPYPLTATL